MPAKVLAHGKRFHVPGSIGRALPIPSNDIAGPFHVGLGTTGRRIVHHELRHSRNETTAKIDHPRTHRSYVGNSRPSELLYDTSSRDGHVGRSVYVQR